MGEKVGEDLRDTWHLIFLSLFSSCLLSFTWLLLMRLLAAPMLWLSILLAVLLLATTTAYSGLRLSAAISSEDPKVSRNFFQVLCRLCAAECLPSSSRLLLMQWQKVLNSMRPPE